MTNDETTNLINLTQHPTTTEQLTAGVTEPADKDEVRRLLTFDELPSKELVKARAKALAEIAENSGAKSAMIGGAPFLMAALEKALREVGITPVYAFSKRESVEKTLPDGSVQKTNVFKHIGFVEAVE